MYGRQQSCVRESRWFSNALRTRSIHHLLYTQKCGGSAGLWMHRAPPTCTTDGAKRPTYAPHHRWYESVLEKTQPTLQKATENQYDCSVTDRYLQAPPVSTVQAEWCCCGAGGVVCAVIVINVAKVLWSV